MVSGGKFARSLDSEETKVFKKDLHLFYIGDPFLSELWDWEIICTDKCVELLALLAGPITWFRDSQDKGDDGGLTGKGPDKQKYKNSEFFKESL